VAKDPIQRAESDLHAERNRVGRNIGSIRRWRNLTQEDLEEATRIDVTRLSRIERGVLNTGINTYIRIAAGLRVPLHWLFTSDWPQYIDDDGNAPAPGERP
jgi:transcriptional regulator with XRE-family HTH domain